MQTFLPYKDFKKSAQALDRQRLGKQRVETMQLMTALTGIKVNPDTDKLMWAGKRKRNDPYQDPAHMDQYNRDPIQRQVPWANHPAARMWRGYEEALMEYQEAICNEWVARGYSDTCLQKTRRIFTKAAQLGIITRAERGQSIYPPWLGMKEFHTAHKSNLTRKDPVYYSLQWSVAPNLEYWWPDNS